MLHGKVLLAVSIVSVSVESPVESLPGNTALAYLLENPVWDLALQIEA